jgi:hypothetical protein
MVKLHQMAVLVSQANDITERELKFIGAYPLGSLLETEAGGLLEEAKQIMDNLVNIHVITLCMCMCVCVGGGVGECAYKNFHNYYKS